MNLRALGQDSDYRVGYGEMGHTIDLDLLPDNPVVLDVGCRGFAFSREIIELRPGARVISLDPDPVIEDPRLPGCQYFRLGLQHSTDILTGYVSTSAWADGGANFLTPLGSSAEKIVRPDCGWEFTNHQVLTVECANISRLMNRTGVKFWDLVKLDCEGAEFGILENWPGPIATQISVEFHDFTGPMRHRVDAGYYTTLMDHLGKWYRFEKHDWVDLNGSPAHFGHWDSLLVMK